MAKNEYVTAQDAVDEIDKAIDRLYNKKDRNSVSRGEVKAVLSELSNARHRIDLRDRLNGHRQAAKDYEKGYFLRLVDGLTPSPL